MASSITEKDLEVISYLLTNEALCAKKARIYANTLMDAGLTEVMNDIASSHEERFNNIFSLISDK